MGAGVVGAVRVRRAVPEDVAEIDAMVHELAEYENEPEAVVATPDDLRTALFGPDPRVFAHVGEVLTEDGWVVAGTAVWFTTYSTWHGKHGTWLEDLFVRPAHRGASRLTRSPARGGPGAPTGWGDPGVAPARAAVHDGDPARTSTGGDVVGAAGGTAAAGDRVELVVPADPAYLSVLRTATAGLAARLDLTIDEIEDLRIAVDEACALVLGPQALDGSGERHGVERDPGEGSVPDAVLSARFDLAAGGMRIEVSGPARTLPGRESFAWAVLEALVSGLETGRDDAGRHCIRLRHDGPRRDG